MQYIVQVVWKQLKPQKMLPKSHAGVVMPFFCQFTLADILRLIKRWTENVLICALFPEILNRMQRFVFLFITYVSPYICYSFQFIVILKSEFSSQFCKCLANGVRFSCSIFLFFPLSTFPILLILPAPATEKQTSYVIQPPPRRL